MNKASAACLLAALGALAVVAARLSRTQADLDAARNSISRLEQREDPRPAIDAARAETDAAKGRIAEMEVRIVADQKALAAAQEHLRLADSLVHGGTPVLMTAKGSYALGDGTVVYGPDVRVRLKNGVLVSSPTGVMVSDASLEHIDGDLVIESATNIANTTNAYISMDGGHMDVTAETLSLRKK